MSVVDSRDRSRPVPASTFHKSVIMNFRGNVHSMMYVIINNERSYENIQEYIHKNPMNWEEDNYFGS
jgi:hypothetical protein